MTSDTDTQQTLSSRPGARSPAPPSSPRRGAGIDIATIVSLFAAFGLIAMAIILGGSWGAFVDLPAFLIVIGGTLAVTFVSFSVSDIIALHKVLRKCWRTGPRSGGEVALLVLRTAERSRREGVINLHRNIASLRLEPFFVRGIGLAADGLPSNQVEEIMHRESLSQADRHQRAISMLFRAADVAPAMGLIGTLIGLVQMLGNLDDPATIGPSMAVALLTTFYGAILANMVFAPLATKLERRSVDEAIHNQLYLLGSAAIGRQENPRRLELLLNTILPPSERVAYFK